MEPTDSENQSVPSVPMEDLFAQVYARLKAMAAKNLRDKPNATLETTGLVHELFLRMSSNRELQFAHQSQFFSYAAQAMRHLLADRARDRLRQRAGGDWARITLTGGDDQFAIESAEQALTLDGALDRLAQTDARAAQVLELHYFAGLTVDQIAEMLDIGKTTVERDWRFARAFLKKEVDPMK